MQVLTGCTGDLQQRCCCSALHLPREVCITDTAESREVISSRVTARQPGQHRYAHRQKAASGVIRKEALAHGSDDGHEHATSIVTQP